MNRDDALHATKRLRQLIEHFGGPYTADLEEFGRLLSALRSGPLQDPYFFEKLADLEDQANTGFSHRKFAEAPGGVSQVKVWALGALGVVESLIEQHWQGQ